MATLIKEVYAIVDQKDNKKSHWSKVGVAFINKDDSINVILDALPISGKLNIRDKLDNKNFKPRENYHENHV